MKNYILQTEHQIQNTILQYLSCMDVWAYRVNSGKYSVGEGYNRRFIMGAPAGTPDIIGVLGKQYKRHMGQMIAIEVKRPGGKTTEIQQRTIEELIKHGAYAFVAYSIDDVLEQLERLKK